MRLRNIFAAFTALLTVMILAAPSSARVIEKVQYVAVMMDGKKIGYGKMTREVVGDKVKTSEYMNLTITRGDVSIQMKITEAFEETVDGKPLSFRVVHDMGVMAATIVGKINAGGKIDVETSAGGKVIKKTVTWPEGAMMPEALRVLAKRNGLVEGTKYAVKVFSAADQKAMDAEISVGKTGPVDLFGRVVTLTRVNVTIKSSSGAITATSYVNADQDALKTVVPMMGMKLELIVCSEQFAKSPNQPVDFFDKLFIKSPKPFNPAGASAISYTLEPLAGKGRKLRIPETGHQRVHRRKDGNIQVTVSRVKALAGQPLPYKGKDAQAISALKPTRYIQSDDAAVIALAKQVVGDTKDAAEAARKIEQYVHKYINKKDLSIGYASAAEVAKSRQGDCSEHAVLTAALCRAVGIPARIVMGVAYVKRFGGAKDIFGPHAWNSVYIGGKWVDLDATFGRFGPGHIALAGGDGGDPGDFFGMINTLGYFRIVRVSVVREKGSPTPSMKQN